MNVRRLVPRSLTSRLVATAVLLVAVVGLLVSAATALAMHDYLTGQKDKSLEQSLTREQGNQYGQSGYCPASLPIGSIGPGRGLPPGQGVGTVTVRVLGNADCAYYISRDGGINGLSVSAVRTITGVATDSHVHTVDIDGLGQYRVLAAKNGSVFLGLPTNDIHSAVRSLVLWELALTVAGVGLAALVGDLLVRRQLRPLREVAATAHEVTGQDLVSGDVVISNRVDERHTDPDTEVGQVGSALNTLLDHVDAALTARHRSEQQVRQFVADASHELRTPLSTIHGYAELSRRTPDDSAALTHAMGKVETEAHRMSGLVEDMLLLARLDSGRPLAREPVDLTQLAVETVTDARVVDDGHQWRLSLPEEPVQVIGDEQRLHQVVTNLLNNARAHTPDGTTVTLSVSPADGWAWLVVHDDGPGLPHGLTEHAFERFTRGDSSRTRASGGAGLGLSMVAAIAQAHGGAASVRSQPGDTSFEVVLPLA